MTGKRWAALFVAVVLIGAWVNGSFDRALAPVGMNWHECSTNAFGATFCGADRERYEREVSAPARDALDEFERESRVAEEMRRQDEAWARESAVYCAEFPDGPAC